MDQYQEKLSEEFNLKFAAQKFLAPHNKKTKTKEN